MSDISSLRTNYEVLITRYEANFPVKSKLWDCYCRLLGGFFKGKEKTVLGHEGYF